MAQILIFGDSIADGAYDEHGGWVDRLKQHFMEKNMQGNVLVDESNWVYNLGISGNTSRDLLERFDNESTARKADRNDKVAIFIIVIGTNDSRYNEPEGKQPEMSVEDYSKNVVQLIDKARKYSDKILLVNSLPVDESKTTPIYGQYVYLNSRINEFNTALHNLAESEDVDLLDLNRAAKAHISWNDMLIDGLHPNPEGHIWIYKQIKPTIVEFLKPH